MSPAQQNTPSEVTAETLPLEYRGPAAWYGRDLKDNPEWIYHFDARDLRELRASVAQSEARGVALIDVDAASFPLPSLGPRLRTFRDEVLKGQGFQVLRGLPVAALTMEQTARIYLGIGAYIGRPVSQNAMGHVLGHVRDLNYDVDDPNVRTYQTTARQFFHADSCDVVGLLCVRPAMEGGLSSIVSSVTLYNEMTRRRPDLAQVLSAPIAIDRRGEIPEGKKPYFMVAVFNHFHGLVSCYYSRRYAESAQRFDAAPRLTPAHLEAFNLLDELMEVEDLQLKMALEPGDVQFVHNHTILHDRTSFVDWPEADRKRHLLRLWLCPPNGRPLPECYADRWGGVEIGSRGGIRVPGALLVAPLDAV